jgi:putative component of membrane protein insertase Oxa1/YidC/SpoIIIJ protein YidD
MREMDGAARSHEELGYQLDTRMASRGYDDVAGRGGITGGDSDKVVLLTKYFVPPSVVPEFKNKCAAAQLSSLRRGLLHGSSVLHKRVLHCKLLHGGGFTVWLSHDRLCTRNLGVLKSLQDI